MGNAAAFAALQAHIDRVRSIPDLGRVAAPEIAQVLEREVLANVARQVGPDGKPWPPTEAGTPALQHTSAALTVRALGAKVVASLKGVHARHHHGRVRGGKARPILPIELSPAMAETISGVLERGYREHMGGA